ncbi:hypothetical protein ABW21_db0200849 [Orbilia brochopaga]|nr:hypothetical protein ABW21_db0200849 [Drechslerella brochopaga]
MGKTLAAILASGLYLQSLLSGVSATPQLRELQTPPVARPPGAPSVEETSSGWKRANIGIDATNQLMNPANLVAPVHNLEKNSKRHPFPKKHPEILVGPTFPKAYAATMWQEYSDRFNGYGNDDPSDREGRLVTTNTTTCRPFYYSCDRQTYIEACNFGAKQVKLSWNALWKLTKLLIGSLMPDIAANGATFLDTDVDWDNEELKGHAKTIIPALNQYDPDLVGYVFMSDAPDIGAALYYNTPLARQDAWINHFKFKCDGNGWEDVA